MYCGDEVAAIVGDLGYSNARFGFAGEDLPKAILPGQVLAHNQCTATPTALKYFPLHEDILPPFYLLRMLISLCPSPPGGGRW